MAVFKGARVHRCYFGPNMCEQRSTLSLAGGTKEQGSWYCREGRQDRVSTCLLSTSVRWRGKSDHVEQWSVKSPCPKSRIITGMGGEGRQLVAIPLRVYVGRGDDGRKEGRMEK